MGLTSGEEEAQMINREYIEGMRDGKRVLDFATFLSFFCRGMIGIL